MSESRVVQVVMPQMGESLSEGTIVKWLKQPGDRIGHDEPLFELSTDKVDTEVPAPAAGVLAKILAREGETVAVGATVAIIEAHEERAATTVGTQSPSETVATQSAAAGQEEPSGHFKSTHAPQLVSFRRERGGAVSAAHGDARPTAPAPVRPSVRTVAAITGDRSNRSFSPAVLADAQRAGLSLNRLTSLSGSGRGGRITKRDVQQFLESGGREAVQVGPPSARGSRKASGPPPEFLYRPADGDRVMAMSPIRKRIARHMRWSVRISAHATAQGEVDMSAVTAVLEHRDAFRAHVGAPLTYTVFSAAACVRALQEFPVLNSSIVGDQIVFKPTINLSMAVALADTDELIAPVVRAADNLSLIGLARAIHEIVTKARSRQLRPEDVQGGTFTLTNPGVFGGITGTPILNQPQVAILSLGAVRKQPVVVDDVVVVRPMMALALTFDHRATDGMVAFRFLARVRALLETLPADWKWTP
jgi:2-oxoglutarate dehydrogenase E2 component (dihydrolipoamide succinyltransferase)